MCGVNKCRGYIRGDIDVGLRAAFFALHRPPHLPSVASLTWYRCQVNPRRSPREALACPRAPSPREREAPLPPDASCGKGHLHHLAQTPREIQGGVPTRGQGEYAERDVRYRLPVRNFGNDTRAEGTARSRLVEGRG